MSALLSSNLLIFASIFLSITLFGVGLVTLKPGDQSAGRFDRATRTAGKTPRVTSLLHKEIESPMLRFLEPLQRAIAQSDKKQVGLARARMIQAGFYRSSALDIYYTSRLVLGIGLAVLSGLYIFLASPVVTTNQSLFAILGSAAFGYYLPALIISSRVSERKKAFRLGMPDALDMLLVGVEGGLSLQAAMRHVSERLAETHPIVAEQLQTVTLEFQAGKSRGDALRSLATRMDVQETQTLASMIVQAETLGTSLSQTLRVMADEMRVARMLVAEKKASELPVKMAVPLVLCIFPSLMAVALVPAMLSTLAFFSSL